jgi:hypothetical protein
MDVDAVDALGRALVGTGWWQQARVLVYFLRHRTRVPSGLLVVGTPAYEPFHLVGHLDDAARMRREYTTRPVLVRWVVESDVDPYFSVDLARVEAAGRGETLLMVLPTPAPDELVDRAIGARRRGATILSMDANDPRLGTVSHARMNVASLHRLPGAFTMISALSDNAPARTPRAHPTDEHLSFELAEHLLAAAAHEPDNTQPGVAWALSWIRQH